MGKKTRRNVPQPQMDGELTDTRSIPFKTRRQLDALVHSLLQYCSASSKDWASYVQMYDKLQEIQKIEKDYILPKINREEHFDAFLEWLSAHGTGFKQVEIALFDETGYGIKALQDIKENDLWLSLPRKVMLSLDTAIASPLGLLIEKDPLLQNMANVTLALHLLNERCEKKSFWAPYIATLPDVYDTPMYFSPEELQHLKGSTVLDDAIKQCQNIVRQYAYFYTLFQKFSKTLTLAVKNHFTYDSYRWCVSAVMTRQNSIPSPDGSRRLLALLPMWDMCNHTNGKLATDYNIEKDQLESFSFRPFKAGEQIFIFYGQRPNSELLVHNGFVYADNPYDVVSINLDLRKSDPLYPKKEELLAKIGITLPATFSICKGPQPIDGALLAFHRTSAMNESVLQDCSRENLCHHLTDLDYVIDADVERTCWKLLHTRLQHLLGACPPPASHSDEGKTDGAAGEGSSTTELSPHAQIAVLLRRLEGNILADALDVVTARQNEVDKDKPAVVK